MPDTRLVYLVWAPLGVGELERFLVAHAAHDPGRPHRLTVILNGFASPQDAASHRALLREVEHDVLIPRGPVQDLAAYAAAARLTREPIACFVNSYSRPLADGWLELLCGPLAQAGVGAVSATATYESHLTTITRRGVPRSAREAVDLARHAVFFEPFPSPSLRTNAFALDPRHFRPRRVSSKFLAHAYESGRFGLTAQLRARGLRPLVAGRDGRTYEVEGWPESATFRAGGQRNLLVADNRTEDWRRATPDRQRELTFMAWGPLASAAGWTPQTSPSPS